jgi:hypothetical protein
VAHYELSKINLKEIYMKLLAAVLVALFFTGCQTMPYQPYARDVKRMPNKGGVIALHTEHREEDLAKADMMMQKNCGDSAVKIKEEGEVAVGQATSGNASETRDAGNSGSKVGSLFGVPLMAGATEASKNTATTTTTTAVKEWQIVYDCGSSKTKKR